MVWIIENSLFKNAALEMDIRCMTLRFFAKKKKIQKNEKDNNNSTLNHLSFTQNLNVTAIGGKKSANFLWLRLAFFPHLHFILLWSLPFKSIWCMSHRSCLSLFAAFLYEWNETRKKNWNCGQMSVHPIDIDNVSRNVKNRKCSLVIL